MGDKKEKRGKGQGGVCVREATVILCTCLCLCLCNSSCRVVRARHIRSRLPTYEISLLTGIKM